MTFLIGFLTVLQLLAAFLLIGIILIQQSKAGGGLGAMGGGTTETVFGATAGNVLTKGTVILASVFLCSALLVQVINAHVRPTASATEALTSEKPKAEEPAKKAPEDKDAPAKTDEKAAAPADAKADAKTDEAKAEPKAEEPKAATDAKADEAPAKE
jgi:preprotein translocase subunit SecG